MRKQDLKVIFNLAVLGLMTTLFVGAALGMEMNTKELSSSALQQIAFWKYAEWFVLITLYPSAIMLLFIAFSLHIARPMVTRYLNRMTLRLGADILWEAWIIGRDVLILSAVGFIGLYLMPRVQNEWSTPVLIPAFVLGIITLVYKLLVDTDASKKHYIAATVLTGLTLTAAAVPFAFAPLWEEKGMGSLIQEFYIPISQKDLQTQMTNPNIIPIGTTGTMPTNQTAPMNDSMMK